MEFDVKKHNEKVTNLRIRLNNYIKENGLKKQFVAAKIGITPSKLSYFLHGKLFVTDDFAKKLDNFLSDKGI